jgi:hypothetical protein
LDVLGFEITDEQRTELEQEKIAKEERAEEMAERLQGNNGPNGGSGGHPEKPGIDPFVTEEERGKSLESGDVYGTKSSVGDVMRSDLGKWQEKAVNWLNRGNPGKGQRFESEAIPDVLSAAISGALEETETEDDVAQVFSDIWLGYP